MKKWFVLALTSWLSVVMVQAQSASPSPAPSKTPEPSPSPVLSVTQTTQETASTGSNAFTQADLSVLVGNVQRPNGIVWFDDQLYTACNGDWTLYEVNSVSGETRTFIFGIQNAHTLYAEKTEAGFNLWVPDFDTNRIMLLDQNRSAPRVIAEVDTPWGIAPLGDDFMISNVRGNALLKLSRTGELETLLDGLRSPAGLAQDAERVYIANNGSARRAIEWLPIQALLEGNVAELTPRPLVSGLQNASGLVMGPDGFLYLTYALGTRGVVGRIDPTQCVEGGCTNEQVEIVVYTDLQAPLAGLAISPDRRLFMHTIFRPEIYWVDLDG